MGLSDINEDIGPGGPVHKFAALGDGIAATVIDGGWRQSRDMDGKLKTFDDGNPQKTYWVRVGEIQKAVSDGVGVTYEDGVCRLFFQSLQSRTFREAVAATPTRKLAEGDLIAVKVHNLKKNTKGSIPIKEITIVIKSGNPESIAYAQAAKATEAKTVYNEDEEPF